MFFFVLGCSHTITWQELNGMPSWTSQDSYPCKYVFTVLPKIGLQLFPLPGSNWKYYLYKDIQIFQLARTYVCTGSEPKLLTIIPLIFFMLISDHSQKNGSAKPHMKNDAFFGPGREVKAHVRSLIHLKPHVKCIFFVTNQSKLVNSERKENGTSLSPLLSVITAVFSQKVQSN